MDLSTKDTLLYNTNWHLPDAECLQISVGNSGVDESRPGQRLKLDQKIKLTKANLLPDTWSPLRDKYPDGGEVTLQEVLMYTVTYSDNNGCDILFNLMKGTKNVDKYVKGLDINEMAIEATEARDAYGVGYSVQ
ncbi:MAG: serine hydrolase [Bacteroidota bacterium]